MIGAAFYLSRRSLANATRRRVGRLRQPKYLLGFCVGVLYFIWLIARPGGRQSVGGPFAAMAPALGQLTAVAGLAALVLVNWVLGSAETPLTFQLAETDFLFTAPLTRRQVLQFRLLRTQLPLFMSAVFSVLVFSGGHSPSRLPLRVVGLWLLYFTLQLHYAGAAIVRGSLTEQGLTGVQRKILTLAVLGIVGGSLWVGLRSALPDVLAAWHEDPAVGAAALAQALRHGALGVALWPLFAAVGPLVADGYVQFLARLPAALFVAGVHYVWVLHSTLAFEEAAVEHAGKVARRLEAMRRGRSDVLRAGRRGKLRAVLPLGARGAPAPAIVWKNATGALREFRLRTVFVMVAMTVATASAFGRRGSAADLLAILALASAGVVTLLGPLALRHDLRRDLELLDVLKTYPLRGREVVAAEVLGPTLVLSGLAGVGVCGAFVASLASRARLPGIGDRFAFLAAALALLPAVIAVLVLVQNAAVLLFPAWTATGPERATGFEATGQRIVTFVGTTLALVVAMLPAALGGGVVALAGRAIGVGTAWTGTIWAFAAAALLGLECYLGIVLLGPVFDRLDPSGLR